MEHFAVEEEDGAEGLVPLAPPARAGVGGGGDVTLSGEVCKESLDLRSAHIFWVAFLMKDAERVAASPIHVGFLGAVGVMFDANGIAYLIKKFFRHLIDFPNGVSIM